MEKGYSTKNLNQFYRVINGGMNINFNQPGKHSNLSQTLADSVSVSINCLQLLGAADRDLITIFSEFERRVEENGCAGTDHGTAALMFVKDKNTRGGIPGKIQI